MARDYKNRASANRKKPQQATVAWWKWLLVFLLIALFVIFLRSLSHSTPEINIPKKQVSTSTISVPTKIKRTPKHQDNKPVKPKYQFYTILPETEEVIPDYEIKTRGREEKVGKRKSSNYVVQAGSFRHFNEADKLRATLALMGIESKIEKATVGSAVWNRVKIGPYSQSTKVSKIKKQLKQNGIDTVIIEVKK